MAKPFVLLKLDKEYEFRITNKAGYIYEEMTGKSIMTLGENFGLYQMNNLVYAGLKCIDKDITMDKVIDLIDEHISIEDLSEILEKAMTASTFFNPAKNQKKITPVKN